MFRNPNLLSYMYIHLPVKSYHESVLGVSHLNMVPLPISGDVFLLYHHLSTWQIMMLVVFPILTSASATFLIAMFTLMCWRKHKHKSLKG